MQGEGVLDVYGSSLNEVVDVQEDGEEATHEGREQGERVFHTYYTPLPHSHVHTPVVTSTVFAYGCPCGATTQVPS